MTLRWAAVAAVLVMTIGCGGGNDAPATADLKVSATNGSDSSVSGKLAPSLGPPPTLIVLEPQGGAELPVKAEPAIMDQAGYLAQEPRLDPSKTVRNDSQISRRTWVSGDTLSPGLSSCK
jgi:hypothetical protein